MKKQMTHSKSSIFLMEIIIAILFFSLVSATCLQIFVRSHNLSKETTALNMSVSLCSSVAEIIKSADTPEDALETLKKEYPMGSVDNNMALLAYSKDWEPCSTDDADCGYQVLVTCMTSTKDTECSGLLTWHITARPFSEDLSGNSSVSMPSSDAAKEDIYHLEVEVYYEP